jgi:hypothetical protein
MPNYKVVVRAFYEDAYLDFFIKWYLELGFDRIDILKADYDIHGDGGINTSSNDKVRIIPVANTGNQILIDMYHVFRDLEFDWVLNIDADEFLMIDRNKYPKGIHDMVTDVESWMIGNGVPATNLQMMAFNWICIDKLDIKPGSGTNGACTMQDMIAGYPLHVYSYIKSFVKPNELPEKIKSEANCHNMITMANKVYGGQTGARTCHVLGDTITEVAKHRQHINTITNNFKWGYILHLNTRSLANALTKSLVTQLRRQKQITDLSVFTTLINSVDIVKLESEDPTYKHGIMEKFKSQLNLKWWFPVKVRNYHNGYKDSITEQVDYATNILKTCKTDIMTADIVNRDTELALLEEHICRKLNIDWEKCKLVLELF